MSILKEKLIEAIEEVRTVTGFTPVKIILSRATQKQFKEAVNEVYDDYKSILGYPVVYDINMPFGIIKLVYETTIESHTELEELMYRTEIYRNVYI